MKNCILDITHQEYIEDACGDEPTLSRSTLRDLIYKTPQHVFHGSKKLNPGYVEKVSDKKFDIGTASHDMLLEGANKIEVIDADNFKGKVAQELAANAREVGKVPLLTKQAEEVMAMVSAAIRQIMNCPDLGITDLANEGKAEQTYVWKSGKTWMRARPDWVRNDGKLILDYKTTGELADPDGFAKKVLSYGYDIQDVLYSDGVGKLHGVHDPHFVFIVQETKAPYLCSFIDLPAVFTEIAEDKIRVGKGIWQKCLDLGEWPGYPNQICSIDAPDWAVTQWEYRKAVLL